MRDIRSDPPRARRREVPTAPVPLASLRLSPLDAADLRWLLQRDFVGDLGVRSNFGDMLERLSRESGHRPADEESWHVIQCHETISRKPYAMDEHMLRAADRLERVLKRWRALHDDERATLRLIYGETRRVLPEWGDLGPLVLESSIAQAAHARSGEKRELSGWLARLVVRPAKASLASTIRRDAESRLLAACRAWERTYERRRRAA